MTSAVNTGRRHTHTLTNTHSHNTVTHNNCKKPVCDTCIQSSVRSGGTNLCSQSITRPEDCRFVVHHFFVLNKQTSVPKAHSDPNPLTERACVCRVEVHFYGVLGPFLPKFWCFCAFTCVKHRLARYLGRNPAQNSVWGPKACRPFKNDCCQRVRGCVCVCVQKRVFHCVFLLL